MVEIAKMSTNVTGKMTVLLKAPSVRYFFIYLKIMNKIFFSFLSNLSIYVTVFQMTQHSFFLFFKK